MLLLVVGLPLTRSAHWAIEPHFLCAEHGTLEHRAEAAIASTESASADPTQSASGLLVLSEDSGSREPPHESCPLDPFTRQAEFALRSPASGLVVLVASVAVAASADAERASAVPLLLQSPKHSPPA